jgi:SAM-dependent methyltransferase
MARESNVTDRERWNDRWQTAAASRDLFTPSSFLVSLAALLPTASRDYTPRALDVAGGPGRNALWLAARGFGVTLVDVSSVALELARDAATAAGVSLTLVEANLESGALPPGPFDVIVAIDYLHRPLFSAFVTLLTRGGLLVYAQPTKKNMERNTHPSARFLLDDGELPGLVPTLDVVRYDERWFDDRHEARLVARRP